MNINMMVLEFFEEAISRGGAIGTFAGVGALAGGLGGIAGHATGRYAMKKHLGHLENKIKSEKNQEKRAEMQKQIDHYRSQLKKTEGIKKYINSGAAHAALGAGLGAGYGAVSTSGYPSGTRFKITW